ncbi:uncharacterized protein N7473_009025 [Penicillium subrubescens]|uniref:uncharacterized protein n=1 Tax=Penicillium subrubescens TaxID=1316194 RepID=UPI0025458696|nr:uncharacterized protein N7473_009025 [Penicillium subrubescens]KAJ5886351.1 hypothetical protein N7473_009025 [Penicillium subrubescens]
MGAIWSSEKPSSSAPDDLEQPPHPPTQSNYPRYYGEAVPPVCSDRLEDLYDELYEKLYYVQRTNQEDYIVAFHACEKDNPRVEPEEWFILVERIPRVYEYLAHRSANTNINTLDVNVDVDTPIDLHPRIVKYHGRIPVGYLLEKLDPGPLTTTTLPLLRTFPASSRTSSDNKEREPLLLLYYRWTLQSLTLLSYLHSHKTYLMDFSTSTIWLRADLSIALSGFINATIPTNEYPYSPDGTRYEAEIYYPTTPSGHPQLTPKIDLSDWATFVWQLMRQDACSDGKRWALPTDSLEEEEEADGEEEGDVNPWGRHVQRLKEGGDESAEEILEEVREYLRQIGVKMDGEDEVLLDDGRNWEDVFMVVKTDGEYNTIQNYIYKGIL